MKPSCCIIDLSLSSNHAQMNSLFFLIQSIFTLKKVITALLHMNIAFLNKNSSYHTSEVSYYKEYWYYINKEKIGIIIKKSNQ